MRMGLCVARAEGKGSSGRGLWIWERESKG